MSNLTQYKLFIGDDKKNTLFGVTFSFNASLLINWFPIQSSCVQFIFATTMQYSKQKITLKGFQIHPLWVSTWRLILDIANSQYKHDHDLVKTSKLTCFCVDKVAFNFQFRLVALCSVDFCHYDAMLEAKHILKSCQIHPFWVCTW